MTDDINRLKCCQDIVDPISNNDRSNLSVRKLILESVSFTMIICIIRAELHAILYL